MAYGARLESALGSRPHEFESRILRPAPRTLNRAWRAAVYLLMPVTRRRAAGIVLAAAAALAVSAAPAHAGGPGQAQGACSAASGWKLTVNPNDGMLRIKYEDDSSVDGELWLFGIDSGNGALIVEAVAPDLADPDRVLAKARNSRTGETCSGAIIR